MIYDNCTQLSSLQSERKWKKMAGERNGPTVKIRFRRVEEKRYLSNVFRVYTMENCCRSISTWKSACDRLIKVSFKGEFTVYCSKNMSWGPTFLFALSWSQLLLFVYFFRFKSTDQILWFTTRIIIQWTWLKWTRPIITRWSFDKVAG